MKGLLLALLLLTACAKLPPVSAPIATPTAVSPDKGTIADWGPFGAIKVDDSHSKGEEDGRIYETLGWWPSRNLARYSVNISSDTRLEVSYLRSQPALAWKGEEDDWRRMGVDSNSAVGFSSDTPDNRTPEELTYLRSLPALAWPKPRVARLAGRSEALGGLADSGEWVDPLTTHRIFIGRDGPVLISRDIAPDEDFWAGVGVAGCESEWRAAVDSPTGDRGFWQLNRRWQEWRYIRRNWTWEDAKDPEKNTEIAFEIFLEQGWNPWAAKGCVGRSMGTSYGGY